MSIVALAKLGVDVLIAGLQMCSDRYFGFHPSPLWLFYLNTFDAYGIHGKYDVGCRVFIMICSDVCKAASQVQSYAVFRNTAGVRKEVNLFRSPLEGLLNGSSYAVEHLETAVSLDLGA